MRELPSGAGLLDIARDVLREDLLPALPEGKRYQALMVANAMAIVMRQIEAGEGATDVERTALEVLLGFAETPSGLNSEMARRIRGGKADEVDVWQALHEIAVGKVAESNPKYR